MDGLAAALSQMAFGNAVGFELEERAPAFWLAPRPGAFVLELDPAAGVDLSGLAVTRLGRTIAEPVFRIGSMTLDLFEAERAWEAPLEPIFPTTDGRKPAPLPAFQTVAGAAPKAPSVKVARPHAVLTVFPGTNCEYDTAAAFERAGATTETVVFRNLTPQAVDESLAALSAAIGRAQIVMIPGGFSAGDEPEGSGKFNLNNLVDRGRIDPAEAEVFMRLCALVGVAPAQANSIMRRVVVSLGGPAATESESGEVKERVARVAAGMGLPAGLPQAAQAPRLRALEDLLAVPGVDAGVLARLAPFVTVLPARSWINANTASAEVVAAGVPGLTLERARALLSTRDRGQWFINRGDFVTRLRMPELDMNEVRIGITSNWFRVSSVLDTARTRFVQVALVHDDKRALPRVVWLREGV